MKCRLDKPTQKQEKIIKGECKKEFERLLSKYNHEAAIQVLHILRFDYGFGQKRLEEFAEKLSKMQIDLEDKYEMGESCNWWICEKQLKDSGINLDKIL